MSRKASYVQFVFDVAGLPTDHVASLFVTEAEYKALHSLGFFCSQQPQIGSMFLKTIEVDVIPRSSISENLSADTLLASIHPHYCTVAKDSPVKVNAPRPIRQTINVADIKKMSAVDVQVEGLDRWIEDEAEASLDY